MYVKTRFTLINTENGFFAIESDELRFYSGDRFLTCHTTAPEKVLNMITESLLLGNILLDITNIDL